MDRGSSKHGPRLDEEMAQETLGLTQGSATDGRTEEWREPEPSGEDQPDEGLIPGDDAGQVGGAPSGMTPEDREERSRLGRYLPRSVFPAGGPALVEAAQGEQAPDDIVAALRVLPSDRDFLTVSDVWTALADGQERRF